MGAEAWGDNKRRQKDVEARWTKSMVKPTMGTKATSAETGSTRSFASTPSHRLKFTDSQVFEELMDENNSNRSVWADSAYRSVELEAALPGAHYCRQIHRKPTRKRPLNEREQEANRKRSRVRARVEHVFAQQANRLVRSIGQVRVGGRLV